MEEWETNVDIERIKKKSFHARVELIASDSKGGRRPFSEDVWSLMKTL